MAEQVRGPARPIVFLLVAYADGTQERWCQQDGGTAWLRKVATKAQGVWDSLEVQLLDSEA